MSSEQTLTSSLSMHNGSALLHELEYLAYHGQNTAAYDLYKKIDLQERDAYQSVAILSSVIRGSIARLKKGKAIWELTVTGVIDEVLSEVERDLNQFILYCTSRDIRPRELYTCVLDYCNELTGRTKAEDALHLLERAEELNIRSYPDLYARLILRRAEILFEMGRLREAHQVISVMVERYYLIPDWNLIPGILFLFSQTSLLTGEARSFTTLLFNGLRHFYTRSDIRRLFTGLLSKAYRYPYRVLLDRDRTISDKFLFVAHWLDHAVHSSWLGRKSRLDRATRFTVLSFVYVLNYAIWQNSSPRNVALAGRSQRSAGTRKAILVTRAMGGIGDFLTMTPGFHALKTMYPDHEIHLAVPQHYQSLFRGNADVTVLDIEKAVLEIGSYVKWFNLTDCPASRIESRTAPNVTMNRIDIFARALGIRGRRFRNMDRLPRYVITEDEKIFQQDFWSKYGLKDKVVIGIQLQAAESYKDFPHQAELVRELASEFTIILFHIQKKPILPGNNVIDPGSITIRQAFALAAACNGIVAPDSAFVHFAGAFDIPCIALEGPVGRIGTRYYPSCTCVDARRALKCIPCWRNEYTPCKLTDMRSSACMEHITVDEICSALKKTLKTQERPCRDLS